MTRNTELLNRLADHFGLNELQASLLFNGCWVPIRPLPGALRALADGPTVDELSA